MTLRAKVDRFPPCLCRLLARRGNGLMSSSELARRSGLSKSYVAHLSLQPTWGPVPIETAEKFAAACGVNLLAQKRARRYLKVRNWGFLVRHLDTRQRGMFERLLERIATCPNP